MGTLFKPWIGLPFAKFSCDNQLEGSNTVGVAEVADARSSSTASVQRSEHSADRLGSVGLVRRIVEQPFDRPERRAAGLRSIAVARLEHVKRLLWPMT